MLHARRHKLLVTAILRFATAKKKTQVQKPRIAQTEILWHDDRNACRSIKPYVECVYFLFFGLIYDEDLSIVVPTF